MARGSGRDGFAEVFGIVRLDEGGVDAQAAEAHVELRVGAAVERAGGDHLIALPGRLVMARNCAACPLDVASAAMPPSSAATRCSNTSVVGFMMRL